MPSILITGTNRGIGLELVRQYLSEGWSVYATARDLQNATELQQLATDKLKYLQTYSLDVTNNEQRLALADQLKNIPLDILINNAGV